MKAVKYNTENPDSLNFPPFPEGCGNMPAALQETKIRQHIGM